MGLELECECVWCVSLRGTWYGAVHRAGEEKTVVVNFFNINLDYIISFY